MCSRCRKPQQQRILLPEHPIDLHELGVTPDTPPDLGLVREDIARIPDAEEAVSVYLDRAPSIVSNAVLDESLPRSVLLYALLPALFKYSFLIDTNDVPEDIVASVVWSLETFGKFIDESSEQHFGSLICGSWTRENGVNLDYSQNHIRRIICGVRPYFGRITRMKAAALLLTFQVDKPSDALRHLTQAAKHFSSAAVCGYASIWSHDLLNLTGEALARSGEDDETAEKLLGLLADPSNVEHDGIQHLIMSKTFLARVLRRRGRKKAAKKHEKWVINWFRKNGRMFSEGVLQMLLMPTDGSVSPILEALGGPSWLQSSESQAKQQGRCNRYCFYCGGREPMVTLSLCSNCKAYYYCSRKCQKEDWSLHKSLCSLIVQSNEEIEQLSQGNPATAQKEKDWLMWIKRGGDLPYVDALRLHEDPGRARTHAIVEESVYTPNAGSRVADKFKVVKCSVFPMSAVIAKLESVIGLDPGEYATLFKWGPKDSELEGSTQITYFVNRVCSGMITSTMLHDRRVRKDCLMNWQYNPNWRQEINKDVPPIPFELAPGVRDAEFD